MRTILTAGVALAAIGAATMSAHAQAPAAPPAPTPYFVGNALYAEYRRLYDTFGRGENDVMKTLRRLRRA